MKTILKVENLHKAYKDIKAVKGVSFEVMEGQLFAFLGPNGAGKSTTIDILCTLLKPDQGEVTVNGHRLGVEDALIKKDIGVVFQDNLLDEQLTVRENLRIRGSLYGLSGKELDEYIVIAVQATGIEDLLDRKYGELSGGQQRRSDIARGLVHRPKLLFLDEPTTGLDPQTRKNVWETLARIQAETNMTIFLTTNYMEEAAQADYISIIDDGKLVANGTPYELKEQYSKDKIIMSIKEKDALLEELKGFPFKYTINKTTAEVAIPRTLDAIPFLQATQAHIDSFEVQTGTMDDVFISITGKEIRQ